MSIGYVPTAVLPRAQQPRPSISHMSSRFCFLSRVLSSCCLDRDAFAFSTKDRDRRDTAASGLKSDRILASYTLPLDAVGRVPADCCLSNSILRATRAAISSSVNSTGLPASIAIRDCGKPLFATIAAITVTIARRCNSRVADPVGAASRNMAKRQFMQRRRIELLLRNITRYVSLTLTLSYLTPICP